MELLQWFMLGVLFSVSVYWLNWLSMEARIKWYTWVLLITGVVLVLFGLAWCGTSFYEGYAQSGAMGMVFIGGAGIILLTVTYRKLVEPNKKKRTN